MARPKKLSASMEDYLEAIYMLARENHVARSKDIAERLDVNRSSVTGMVRTLAERGLVEHERYGYITLTAAGERAAREVAGRHDVLRDFFVKVLCIDPEEADQAACRMEHAVSKRVIERLTAFAAYVERCPQASAQWLPDKR